MSEANHPVFTHSPMLVRNVPADSLLFVRSERWKPWIPPVALVSYGLYSRWR